MDILFASIILFLGHLCVYFYVKNSSIFLNFNYDFDVLKHLDVEKPKSSQKEKLKSMSLRHNVNDNNNILLNKNLKHLEFIAQFEMYLQQKTIKSFSVEFLQEFEKIKIEAQLSVLKSTNKLNSVEGIAI